MRRALLGLIAICAGAVACGEEEGSCPGVIIPACTTTYLKQCPVCPAGDDGWCVGYGFEPNRCCGCGTPP